MSAAPVQIARHTAVVLAAGASLGLTVAAGSYISNQMVGAQQSLSGNRTAPAPTAPRESEPVRAETVLALDSRPLPGHVRPVALPEAVSPYPQRPEITEAAVPPHDSATPPPEATPWLGVRVPLGRAYVGVLVTPEHAGVLDLTLHTDALVPGGRSGNTSLHTEIDAGRGAVSVVFSDPALGEHAFRLNPTPARQAVGTSTETADPAATSAAPQHGGEEWGSIPALRA
ncbi:hypothetical protein [Nocardia panacis]|nr:hypothetical protein [Nocardia panacis]